LLDGASLLKIVGPIGFSTVLPRGMCDSMPFGIPDSEMKYNPI
jgi:hypothetical protein